MSERKKGKEESQTCMEKEREKEREIMHRKTNQYIYWEKKD